MQSKPSRRVFLSKLSAGALLSMGLWPGCRTAPEEARRSSFRFIVVNDTHYMSDDCGVWLEKVVRKMKSHTDAEFCLHLGDLVENGHRAHLGTVSDIFSGLKIPRHVQIGNHDYLAGADRSGYEAVFPKSLNYWFEHQGWQFVAFDSTEGSKFEGTSIQPATMEWLRNTVPKLNRARPTVICTHFPLGVSVKYRPKNADSALDYFREHNLRGVFNGHFHGYTEREWNHAYVVTNRCCALKRTNHDGTKEKGYWLCSVTAGAVSREFVQVS